MRKELLICDGIGTEPCGTVLVNENDGILLHGTIFGCILNPKDQVVLISATGESEPGSMRPKETALCAVCIAKALSAVLKNAIK
jgi:hypothetical protein